MESESVINSKAFPVLCFKGIELLIVHQMFSLLYIPIQPSHYVSWWPRIRNRNGRGAISRSDRFTKMNLQGIMPGKREGGGKKRGRQNKSWEDNIKEWADLRISEPQRVARNRDDWRELILFKSFLVTEETCTWGYGTGKQYEGKFNSKVIILLVLLLVSYQYMCYVLTSDK